MTSNLFMLRDFVERGFTAFEIPYYYTSGEVMEAEIPPGYQPLFGGVKTMKLCFSDAPFDDPSIQRVSYGTLVLDALGRLLEGDQNTVGHALIARDIGPIEGVPEHKDRLNVLNAKVIRSTATRVYRPIIRLEFSMRVISQSGIHSQNVPMFFDLESERVEDGARFRNFQLQDVEEISASEDTFVLKTPPQDALARAANAAVTHLQRSYPALEGESGDTPTVVDLQLARLLVLHDPRAGALITFTERSTKREFKIAFPVAEDPSRIAAPFCAHCGRIKTHYYISHSTGELICTDCSLLCVGCWDAYSLQEQNCDTCTKRRYCPSCLTACVGCGILVCPDHRERQEKTGKAHCEECASQITKEVTEEKEPEVETVIPAREKEAPAEKPNPTDIFSGPNDEDGIKEISADEDETALPDMALDSLEEDIFGESSTAPDPETEISESTDAVDELEPWDEDAEIADEVAAWEKDKLEERSSVEKLPVDIPVVPVVLEEIPLVAAEPELARAEEPPSGGEADPDEEDYPIQVAGHKVVKCACHGKPKPTEDLRIDFLSGQYYCPDQVEPCSQCEQATALDFLDGEPSLCFYCSNRISMNLDPEAEEIFRREIQTILPMKYRIHSCKIARSPHHLAYYIKPLVGKEIILYWDQWTDTLLGDDQFAS